MPLTSSLTFSLYSVWWLPSPFSYVVAGFSVIGNRGKFWLCFPPVFRWLNLA